MMSVNIVANLVQIANYKIRKRVYKLIYKTIKFTLKYFSSVKKFELDFQARKITVQLTTFLLDDGFIEKEFQQKKKKEVVFVINLFERLGDVVSVTPIPEYLKTKYGPCLVIWLVNHKYREVIENNPFVDEIIEVDSLNQVDEISGFEARAGHIIIDCLFDGRVCGETGLVHVNRVNPQITTGTYYMYGGLLEAFCLTAGLPPIKYKPQIYINSESENALLDRMSGRKFVVIHTSASLSSRNWCVEKWTSLVRELLKEKYVVVEIGLETKVKCCEEGFIDASRFNLPLLETFRVVSQANAFVGIDSSFAHVANAFDVPSVIILGKYSRFNEYLPYSNESEFRRIVRNEKGEAVDVDLKSVLMAFREICGMR